MINLIFVFHVHNIIGEFIMDSFYIYCIFFILMIVIYCLFKCEYVYLEINLNVIKDFC
jgi:hypothetical protein